MNVVPTMQKALWFLIKSPVSSLLPLIIEGQQCNEIIQENPIKLAVSYYAFIQGFAINKLQWAECPIPEAEFIS